MSSTRIAAPADLIEAAFGLVCEVQGSDRPACGAEVVVLYQ